MNQLAGKVAVVTGASSGIGAAICKELVKHGMNVVGCARNVQRIEEMEKELSRANCPGMLFPRKCDMSREEDIYTIYNEIEYKFNSFDVCINNAVTSINSSLLAGRPSDWRYMLEVGIMGYLINAREAFRLMGEKQCGDGHIIHMGSIVGYKIPTYYRPPPGVPTPWFHVYNGMKWMLRALAEGHRQEARENLTIINGLKVSTISPGAVETELLARSVSNKMADAFFSSYKCLQPEDVANTVLYILNNPNHLYVQDVILEPVDFQIE